MNRLILVFLFLFILSCSSKRAEVEGVDLGLCVIAPSAGKIGGVNLSAVLCPKVRVKVKEKKPEYDEYQILP